MFHFIIPACEANLLLKIKNKKFWTDQPCSTISLLNTPNVHKKEQNTSFPHLMELHWSRTFCRGKLLSCRWLPNLLQLSLSSPPHHRLRWYHLYFLAPSRSESTEKKKNSNKIGCNQQFLLFLRQVSSMQLCNIQSNWFFFGISLVCVIPFNTFSLTRWPVEWYRIHLADELGTTTVVTRSHAVWSASCH